MRLEVQALLLLVVLIAAFFDLRVSRVPNWLTLSAAIAGIAINTALAGTTGLWMSLKGLGLGLAIYLPLYLLRAVGGGDLKLMAALGAIAGPVNWVVIMILTALLGGIAALVLVIAKRRLLKTLANVWSILRLLARGQSPHLMNPELDVGSEAGLRMPHAAVIAGASVVFLLSLTFGYIKL